MAQKAPPSPAGPASWVLSAIFGVLTTGVV